MIWNDDDLKRGWGTENVKDISMSLTEYEKKIIKRAIPYETTRRILFWYLKKTNRTFFDWVCSSVGQNIKKEYLMLRTFKEEEEK